MKITRIITLILSTGAAVAISAAVVVGVTTYNRLNGDIDRLTADNNTLLDNNNQLIQSIDQLNTTLDHITAQYANVIKINNRLQRDFAATDKRVSELNSRLSQYDIGVLAVAKPLTISRITTDATNDSSRCFEIVSGSPLTRDEINATKKSQANSICPDIANPNYTDQ
jgi:predicted RNase H-like nuclease (RuvC/YqgF family)